jgi:hypothetical protein
VLNNIISGFVSKIVFNYEFKGKRQTSAWKRRYILVLVHANKRGRERALLKVKN